MRSAMDWAQARTMAAEGRSQREIARALGINRRTAKRLIEASEPPSYHREPSGSMLDPLGPVQGLCGPFRRVEVRLLSGAFHVSCQGRSKTALTPSSGRGAGSPAGGLVRLQFAVRLTGNPVRGAVAPHRNLGGGLTA